MAKGERMRLFLETLNQSVKLFLTDRKILILSLFPVIIGAVLYTYLGYYLYTDVTPFLERHIINFLNIDQIYGWARGILLMFISLIIWILVSWTFVLFVSLIAGPFHDLISTRVDEKNKGL